MSVKSLGRKACISYFNRRFKSGRLQMLFIIGHMRSGSSLLVHILNSNSQIIGFGENHSVYHGESDLGKVAFNIYRKFKSIPVRETFVLDKVLHAYLLKDLNLLERAKTILILRNPVEVLPSIHKLNTKKYTAPETFEHYHKQLEQIKNIANKIDPERWVYTTYNELVNQPENTFRRIETFLGLKKQLTQEYNTIWATGISGIGDPSKIIHEGRIVKTKKQEKLPASFKPFVKKARIIYRDCLNELKQNSAHQIGK